MLDLVLAYIDPGTGTILLQLVIGSIIGGGVFLRRSIYRIFGWLGGAKGEAASTSPEASEQSGND